MLQFNTLLRAEGLDPADVKLARHQDTRYPGRPSPYQLWRANAGRLERYQSIQRLAKFDGTRLLASFVATLIGETVFAGLYTINGVGPAPARHLDPISGEDAAGLFLYTMEPAPHLSDFRGKLFIAWGDGYRAWVQSAAKQEKTVIELRRTVSDPPFPGFLDFHARLSDLAHVPRDWRTTLSSVCGIYLLTCPKTGQHYVGSACGPTGFWGRWEDYAASGHGGNKLLREVPESDYQLTILEVAASSAIAKEVIDMEDRWKRKLLSREFGLNAN